MARLIPLLILFVITVPFGVFAYVVQPWSERPAPTQKEQLRRERDWGCGWFLRASALLPFLPLAAVSLAFWQWRLETRRPVRSKGAKSVPMKQPQQEEAAA
jgi:hypothetical protein